MSGRNHTVFEADFPSGQFKHQYVKFDRKFKDLEFITTLYFDSSKDDETELLKPLWKILASIYDFVGKAGTPEPNADMIGTIRLETWVCPKLIFASRPFDSLGSVNPGWYKLEEIEASKCWPKSINFGHLDYSNDNAGEIELTWQFETIIGTIYDADGNTQKPYHIPKENEDD